MNGGIPVGHFCIFCAIFGVKIVPITGIFACGAFLISPIVICKNNVDFFKPKSISPVEGGIFCNFFGFIYFAF